MNGISNGIDVCGSGLVQLNSVLKVSTWDLGYRFVTTGRFAKRFMVDRVFGVSGLYYWIFGKIQMDFAVAEVDFHRL
jgi:hypothetical protein